MRFILFLAALSPSFACAQTFSAHSGWNFQDTLQTATDILVGDASGAAVNTAGSFTQVRVQVRAVRVLSGNVSPGSELSVEWQCQPMPPLPDAGAALDGRALWFLRKREGGFEALAASSWGRFGGAFLPMPGGPLNPALAYTDSQPLPYKLAREIGFSMVEIATGQRAGRPVPAGGGRSTADSQALAMALESLDVKAAAGVYQYFSTLADAGLKLTGLAGRAANGDGDAVLEIERDLPRLAASAEGSHPGSLMRIDVRGNLPALHALGRIALSETPLPGMDMLLGQLAATHNPEFLPYFTAMLRSPESQTHTMGMIDICDLLRPLGRAPEPPDLWKPLMEAYCPRQMPMSDRRQEQADLQFWSDWWAASRDAVARTANLPDVRPPARYSAPAPGPQAVDVPLEVRFESMIIRAPRLQASHYHEMSGQIVNETPPQFPDPVVRELPDSDRPVYREIGDATYAKLQDLDRRGQEMVNETLRLGVRPDKARSKALWAERVAILKDGMQQMQNRMSAEGWKVVMREMMKGAWAGSTAAPPR